ncbi:MAG: LD-carboxypeptidase [Gammaproteobacteria bacterium]|nr:LD-carboxypeptidase [Gammaproteobacteria bacterium]
MWIMRKLKTLALFATASTATEAEVETAIAELKRRYSYEVIAGPELLQRLPMPERAQVFLNYVLDPKIDVLMAIRGGEGSADVIPFLETARESIQKAPPKLLIGMSDITALLFYFHQRYGWPVVHGPGGTHFVRPMEPESLESFDRFFAGQENEIQDLKPLNEKAANTLKLEAELCAGNMSLLNISIKDGWEFEAAGKILAIEDWHEKGYVVDRTLKYFERIGKFKGLKGLIFGDFLAGKLSPDPKEHAKQADYLNQTLTRLAQTVDCPVWQTDWFGHGSRLKPMPFQKVVLEQNSALNLTVMRLAGLRLHQG